MNGYELMKWTRVKDKMPTDYDYYIIHGDFGVTVATLYKGTFYREIDEYNDPAECINVTHWMPLPKPPKP